jgi:nucleoside-diphosphate-sugar epimerase
MKILLTGASSFTGFWFAKLLHKAGHEVVAPLRSPVETYVEGVRADRVKQLREFARLVPGHAFGDSEFLHFVEGEAFDVFCHHAAQVGDYRSRDFDICSAAAANTRNLRPILERLKGNGLRGAVLTGSVFEANEGAGNLPLRAFSPYGLSKGLTAQICEFYCSELGIPWGKFVIPNPFGPFEEPRFCAYLMRTWKAGQVAKVNTPEYVRDNIHVSLLGAAYVKHVEEIANSKAPSKLNPSGYVESQGAFAQRFANEMRSRLDLECKLDLTKQTEFSEPLMRVNTDSAARYVVGWDEEPAWDQVAESYAL